MWRSELLSGVRVVQGGFETSTTLYYPNFLTLQLPNPTPEIRNFCVRSEAERTETEQKKVKELRS